MTAKFTLMQLQNHGLTLDPDDPTVAVPIDTLAARQPDAGWNHDQLGAYAAAELAQASRLEGEAASISRKSTVHLYRAGHALSIVRGPLKDDRRWCEWLRKYEIARTSAWEAIELYERAPSEGEVSGLTRSDAKERYGIYKPRSERSHTATNGPSRPTVRRRAPSDSEEDPDCETHEPGDEGEEFHGVHPSSRSLESPLSILTKINRRLEYLEDEIEALDWNLASPEEYRRVVEVGIQRLENIQDVIP